MRAYPAGLAPDVETIAELRELYRAAEARAARLRLLSLAGQDLAAATDQTLDQSLASCAKRLAFFIGTAGAAVSPGQCQSGDCLAIHAPGEPRTVIAWLWLEGGSAQISTLDPEDRDAIAMLLELIGATMHRIQQEQERQRLHAALQEREQRLAMLVGQMFTAQEEERRRVSHELHDGVAQIATALARMLEGGSGTQMRDLPAARRAELASIARDLVAELRTVIGGLRPTLLDDLGLEAAVRALAEGLEQDGFVVTLAIHGTSAELSALEQTALFRVAQEATVNIRKHAQGQCPVQIELDLSGDGQRLLRIRDTGGGAAQPAIDRAPPLPGSQIGLDVMRERMAAIGGTLDWINVPGSGVTVTAGLQAKVCP